MLCLKFLSTTSIEAAQMWFPKKFCETGFKAEEGRTPRCCSPWGDIKHTICDNVIQWSAATIELVLVLLILAYFFAGLGIFTRAAIKFS